MVVLAYAGSWGQTSSPTVSSQVTASDDRDVGVDFPPLSKGPLSLIGGTVVKVDPIRDRVLLRAFGGRDITVDFDVRTKILREEAPVSTRELRPGARIYADTSLVNGRVFAKTIRISAGAATGEANGQVTAYDPEGQKLKIRNAVAAEPLEVRITPETKIRSGDRKVESSQLTVGTLLHVSFHAREHANLATQIDIQAQPGGTFTFVGKMTFVDLRAGYVAVADQSGTNSYEVAVDHLAPNVKRTLKEGDDVVVHAKFDGQKYQAQSIEQAEVQPH